MANAPYGLETLGKNGKPPASRLNDPRAAHDIVERLIQANDKRSKTDANVFGFFSGNPPFRQSDLNKLGQAFRSNYPSRIGESFLNNALGIYWDMVSEGPTYCAVRTDFGRSNDEREEYSGIISEEFQRLNRADPDLNYMFRLSQFEMVLYRCGPVMWTDTLGYKAKAINQRYVLVPDRTKSNVTDWPMAAVLCDYKADELYGFIRDDASASRRGWKVKQVRDALVNAVHHDYWPQGMRGDWGWYEQQMRNNDLGMSMCHSDTVAVAHVFYREFPKEGELVGRISHCIVLQNEEKPEFLFRSVGRFDNWLQVINPFYYDIGDGTHHSVKGLGIKALGLLSVYDRLQNHMTDAAFFGSSLHFQAKTASDLENLSVVTMGPYVWHPPGGEYLPTQQLGTSLQGPMEVKADLLSTVTNNLAQYRQQLNRQKGNPVTATQIQVEAANLSEIGRSPLSWYFEQCDTFWEERYHRASNLNLTDMMPGGRECIEFQHRCIRRGVPKTALRKTEWVRATRNVGYGSASARILAFDKLASMFPLYGEEGRHRLLEDLTSATVGHAMMRRYVEPIEKRGQPGDQESQAQDKVVAMRVGIMPVVASSQNAVVFAATYLRAAADAAQSLSKGADPAQVFSFLQICGPAIRQQLDRFANDPTRKDIYSAMEKQWKELAGIADKLGAQLQQQAEKQRQQQAQLQQRAVQQNGDMALKVRELEEKLMLQDRKTQSALRQKRQKHEQALTINSEKTRQNMLLADAKTAADISIKARSEEARQNQSDSGE
jgi:hypothetical protein